MNDLLQRQEIPAFLCGVVLGILLVGAFIRIARATRGATSGLTRELRDQISSLKSELSESGESVRGAKALHDQVSRDRDMLRSQLDSQHGTISAVRAQQDELTDECERLKHETFQMRERIKRERRAHRRTREIAEGYSRQIDDVANSDGKVWARAVAETAPRFLSLGTRRTPILAVANLKGGVGKTTITANLGVAFAQAGFRTLLVDLDHQSSLSALCLSEAERLDLERNGRFVDRFFRSGGDLVAFNQCVAPIDLRGIQGELLLAACEEQIADLETQLMLRWQFKPGVDDVRFRLRSALHTNDLRKHYDLVLIDCPPRLTTASVNALLASDGVVIPVLLQETSAESVPRILRWLKLFKTSVAPDVNVLGVVGNRAYPRERLVSREQDIWHRLQSRANEAWEGPVTLFEEVIREHTTIDGRFAALDSKHSHRYEALMRQIRKELPNACFQSPTISANAGSADRSART